MTYQYDAFISYRHHAVDSAVAAEIQHRLEHFRIPRAIQKATGVRKISRIFRDKAELAITSDINEDILNALEHSAFLIVICSTHTAESLWVQREIEIFLRTHTRRQVLTVLVDGEPIDVIPQTLCWQEETVTDADGTERVQRVPVEPLSCDYRASRRQAHREELPRLAAALIGCPYDALRQRQRQYQMRRLAAGFSAALLLLAALAAYFLWSSLRIRENYDQALRSQSVYLASESQNCLAGGDRLTAIHLALAALPSEEQDRPLVAQAEYALSRAAGAYVAPGGSGIEAVCSFQHKAAVRQFFIDDAGERLFVLDGSNTVTIWDKQTYEKIHTKSFPDAVDRILLTGGDLLIAAADKWIAAYDCASGENVWLITEEGNGWWESEELCLTPDGSTLLVVRRDYENAVSQKVMVYINAETGAVERETLLMNAPGEGAGAKKICFSADGRYAAFYDLWLNENNSSVYYAAVYDIARGELTCLPQTYNYIEALCFTQNGDLIVQGMTQDLTGGSERYGNFTIVRTSQTEVFCVDPQSGALRWQNSYDVTNLTIYSAVETLRYPDASGTVHDAVACTDADAGAIFDAETGELLWETKLPAPAVYMDADDESVYWILEDGQTADYTFGSDYVGCLSYFQSGLTAVAANHGIVTQKGRSSELILYYSDVYDEGWRTFEGAEQHPYVHAMSQSGSYLLLYDQNNVLELLDVAGERSCWQLSLAGERYEYTMLGFTADEQEILLYRETYDDAAQPMKVLLASGIDKIVQIEERSLVNEV